MLLTILAAVTFWYATHLQAVALELFLARQVRCHHISRHIQAITWEVAGMYALALVKKGVPVQHHKQEMDLQ
jgi:hypothetical protein